MGTSCAHAQNVQKMVFRLLGMQKFPRKTTFRHRANITHLSIH